MLFVLPFVSLSLSLVLFFRSVSFFLFPTFLIFLDFCHAFWFLGPWPVLGRSQFQYVPRSLAGHFGALSARWDHSRSDSRASCGWPAHAILSIYTYACIHQLQAHTTACIPLPSLGSWKLFASPRAPDGSRPCVRHRCWLQKPIQTERTTFHLVGILNELKSMTSFIAHKCQK